MSEGSALNRRRAVAVWVALCLALTQAWIPPVSAAAIETPGERALPHSFPKDLSQIAVPSNIGKIEESFQGQSENVYILVQDAHAIPDAQRNIRNLIDYFQHEYGLNRVAVEGAASRLNPQIFRSFPDKKMLKSLFMEYLEKGELTGSAMAAIFNEQESLYQGIEDWGLYEEGYGFYLESQNHAAEVTAALNALRDALENEKEKTYSPSLLKVDRAIRDFHENKMYLMKVIETLAEFKAPPKGSGLELMLKESAQASSLAVPVEIEVRAVSEKVRDYLNHSAAETARQSLAEFNEKAQAFQTSRLSAEQFALYLKELCESQKLPFHFSADLNARVVQQKKLQDIEGTRFFDQFEDFVRAVKESLFRGEAERNLDQQSYRLYLFDRLAKMELSRAQWKQLIHYARTGVFDLKAEEGGQAAAVTDRREEGPRDILLQGVDLRRLIPESDLRERMIPHLLFYENAESRDAAFVRNLKAVSTEPSRRGVMLVAGGFHTEGLVARLKAEGCSYVLITPEIKALPEEIHYAEQMQGQVSWKDYFEVERGQMNIYNAFVRYTRDRLLKAGQTPKEWRDQIIRDLADQGMIAQSGQYTRFIDEITPRSSGSAVLDDAGNAAKVDRFISSVRDLQAAGRLTVPNILSLVQPSGIQAKGAGLVLADQWTQAGILPSTMNRIHAARALVSQAAPPGSSEIARSELRGNDLDSENPLEAPFIPPQGEAFVLPLSKEQVDKRLPQIPLLFEAMQDKEHPERSLDVRIFGGAVRALAFAFITEDQLPTLSELDIAVPGAAIYGDKFDDLMAAEERFKELVRVAEKKLQKPITPIKLHPTGERDFSYILEEGREWSISKFWLEYDKAKDRYLLKATRPWVEQLKKKELTLAGDRFLAPERLPKLLDQAYQYVLYGLTVSDEQLGHFERELLTPEFAAGGRYVKEGLEIKEKLLNLRDLIQRRPTPEHPVDPVLSEFAEAKLQELLDFAFAPIAEADRARLSELHRQFKAKRTVVFTQGFDYGNEGYHFITYDHNQADFALKAGLRGQTFPVHFEHLNQAMQIGDRIFAPYTLVTFEESEQHHLQLPEDYDRDTEHPWVVQVLAFSVKEHILALKEEWTSAEASGDQETVSRVESDLTLIISQWKRLMYRAWSMGMLLEDHTFDNSGITAEGTVRETSVSFEDNWKQFFFGSTSIAVYANNANRAWLNELFGEAVTQKVYGEGLNQFDFGRLWPTNAKGEGAAAAQDRRAPIFKTPEEQAQFLENFWKAMGPASRAELRDQAPAQLAVDNNQSEDLQTWIQSASGEAALKFAATAFYLQMVGMADVGDDVLRTSAGVIQNAGVEAIEQVFREVAGNARLEGLLQQATQQVLGLLQSRFRTNLQSMADSYRAAPLAASDEHLASGLIIPEGLNPRLSREAAGRFHDNGVDEIVLSSGQMDVKPFRELFRIFRSVSDTFFRRPSLVYPNLAVGVLGEQKDTSAFDESYHVMSLGGMETVTDTQIDDFLIREVVPNLTSLLARMLKGGEVERQLLEADLIRALALPGTENLFGGNRPNVFILQAKSLELALQWQIIRLVAASA